MLFQRNIFNNLEITTHVVYGILGSVRIYFCKQARNLQFGVAFLLDLGWPLKLPSPGNCGSHY